MKARKARDRDGIAFGKGDHLFSEVEPSQIIEHGEGGASRARAAIKVNVDNIDAFIVWIPGFQSRAF